MLSTWLMTRWVRRTECRAAAAVAEANATVAAEKKRADAAEVTVSALQAEVEHLRAQN